MPKPLWLVRSRPDGGCDYVNVVPSPGAAAAGFVELREGSHLPPQMPLLKRRHRLPADEARRCCQLLQQNDGFRCSDPLF